MTLIKSGYLILLVLALAAVSCTIGVSEPVAMPPTTAPTQGTATAVPQLETAEPTAVAIEPTATTAAPVSVREAQFNGVSFFYDDSRYQRVTATTAAAMMGEYGLRPDGIALYFDGVPDLVKFQLKGDQESHHPTLIVIQPLRTAEGDYYAGYTEGPNAEWLTSYRQQFDDLQAALAAGDANFPEVWPFAAHRAIVSFANGRGVRTLTMLPEEMGLIEVTNRNLYYNFQGLTADGRYFIWAQIPVSAPILSDKSDPTGETIMALVGADGSGYEQYLAQTAEELGKLSPSDFTPTLGQLDDMIATLFVPDDASTTTSLPLNDAGCVNDAAYVEDVTITDGTTVEPQTTFTKTWRIRNTGTCSITAAYTLQTSAPSKIVEVARPQLPAIAPGETAEITLVLAAPPVQGSYRTHWQLMPPWNPEGVMEPFGPRIYADILVPRTAAVQPPAAGDWRISYYNRGPNATLTDDEAQAEVGKLVTFTADSITLGDQSCTGISYTGNYRRADEYAKAQYDAPADIFGSLPDEDIQVLQTGCDIPGFGQFVRKTFGLETVVIELNNIFYTLYPIPE